ncbi:hypothetical protein K1719_010594 [Acacia pycnantha]|nr:hypothetical protein K1719_010594 [Acacia pycnantha]
MALLPSLPISSTPKLHVKLFLGQPCHLPRCSAIQLPQQTRHARTVLMKISMADHNEPDEVRVQIGNMKEKLREMLPIPVQEFPWNIVYTLSINRELVIPIGLLIGCLTADFLKETLRELFHISEDQGLNQQVLGVYCFFVFVKIISACFGIQSRVFLLHVANGGLMQALWYWKSSWEEVKN